MNQFISRTAAAKSRITAEQRSESVFLQNSQVLDFGQIVSEILARNPVTGIAASALLGPALAALKSFALKRSMDRFEFLLEQVSADVQDNIRKIESLEDRDKIIEERIKSPRFEELLSEAANQAIRATAKGKIQRLSHIAVSGAVRHPEDPIEPVLEYERHAVELTDSDVALLKLIDEYQAPFRSAKGVFREDDWIHNVRKSWQEMVQERQYGEASARDARSSLARLQARGLIIQIGTVDTLNSPGTEPYAILNEGMKFLQYLIGYPAEQVSTRK